MKHFIFLKYGRIYYEKVYELWGDYQTAEDFKKALSRQYSCNLILCEVI